MLNTWTNKRIALLLVISFPYYSSGSDIDIIKAIVNRDKETLEQCLIDGDPNQLFEGKAPLIYAIEALVDQTDKKPGDVSTKMANGAGGAVNGALIAFGGTLATLVSTGNLYRNNQATVDSWISWFFEQVNKENKNHDKATLSDKVLAFSKVIISGAKKAKDNLFLVDVTKDLAQKIVNPGQVLLDQLPPDEKQAVTEARLSSNENLAAPSLLPHEIMMLQERRKSEEEKRKSEDQKRKEAAENARRYIEEREIEAAKKVNNRKKAEEETKNSQISKESKTNELKERLAKLRTEFSERTYLANGIESMEKKDYDSAVKYFQQLIPFNPEKGHLKTAEAYQRWGNFERAVAEYNLVLSINPNNLFAKAESDKLIEDMRHHRTPPVSDKKAKKDEDEQMAAQLGKGLVKGVDLISPGKMNEVLNKIIQLTDAIHLQTSEKSLEVTQKLDAIEKAADALTLLLMRANETVDVGELTMLRFDQNLKEKLKEVDKLVTNLNTLTEKGINLGDIAHKTALISIFIVGLLGVGYGLKKIVSGLTHFGKAPVEEHQHNKKIRDAQEIVFMLLSHPQIEVGSALERVRSEMIKHLNNPTTYEALSKIETLVYQRLSIQKAQQAAVNAQVPLAIQGS